MVNGDPYKRSVDSRREKRKAIAQLKSSEREENSSAVRGFSTDQRISIESMNIQKESVRDRKRESRMVALSIQQTSISNLLNQAEIRAGNRYPSYDKDNVHWKRVDNLIVEQDKVMEKLLNFDKDDNNSKSSEYAVRDFIKSENHVKRIRMDLSDVNLDFNDDTEQVQDITL